MMGINRRCRQVFVYCGLVLTLSACQSYWDADPNLGSSVNDAIRAQVANPNAPEVRQTSKSGMDGVAAKKSVDNYQKSFDAKESSANMSSLVNINNASTDSNNR